MKSESRIIKASVLTGFTEMAVGLFMALTGWHTWYNDHFHFFGVLGLGMAIYGFWHGVLFRKEKGQSAWKTK
jgi:hypothetical protein